MEYFQPVILSTSRRPELLPNETLLIQHGHIGIYEGKRKVEKYQDGVCYLTSHRIVYVDTANPLENSIELNLSIVKDIESYSGFLRSSPKIIINIDPALAKRPQLTIKLESNESSTSISGGGNIWVCSICFFSNNTNAETCELCGVRKQGTENVVADQAEMKDSSTCTVCTFQNHPSMMQCEMCGADLPKEIIPTVTSSSSSTSTSNRTNSNATQVRLSFRQSGHSSFLSKLKGALAAKKWEEVVSPLPASQPSTPVTRGVGISAIEDRIEKTNLEANETMTDAFQDLDRLMAKANDMVKLAESISNKISKDPSNDNNELSALRTQLLNLGIASPVTKGSAGSLYHQELARELSDFLIKLFEKEDDIKSLTDVYCLFNRARGVALISPEDLYKASQQFEHLKLPFTLRQFPSGLLVIQSVDMNDNRAATRILRHVKDNGSLNALQLAELEKLALAVATEQLIVTERMGLVCRDDGPAGLVFYENLFLVS